MSIGAIGLTPNYRVQRQSVSFTAIGKNSTGDAFVRELEKSVAGGKVAQVVGDSAKAIQGSVTGTPCLSDGFSAAQKMRETVTPDKK